MTRDDEEPVPTARGLWDGEVTGLRLGDAPKEDGGSTGKQNGMRFTQNMTNIQKCSDLGTFYGQSLTCPSGPHMVGESNRGRPLLGNGEQVCIGPVRQTWAGEQNTYSMMAPRAFCTDIRNTVLKPSHCQVFCLYLHNALQYKAPLSSVSNKNNTIIFNSMKLNRATPLLPSSGDM